MAATNRKAPQAPATARKGTKAPTTARTARKAPLADLAKAAQAPAAPTTTQVTLVALTGAQPEGVAGRKGKPFRANSQRAVVWEFISKQLHNGPMPLSAAYTEFMAAGPAPRVKGKIAGLQSAASGWYGRYTQFGLLKQYTGKVDAKGTVVS